MNGIKHGTGRLAAALRRAVRRFVSVLAELDYAQRRANELFLTGDGYLIGPATPAGTYQEFLDRTARPLVHEPSAAARLAGQPVADYSPGHGTGWRHAGR
jgi:hypothetical protein